MNVGGFIMSKVLVVGGGAAGMMAAITAAYNGNEVHLFEKSFIGRKRNLQITTIS